VCGAFNYGCMVCHARQFVSLFIIKLENMQIERYAHKAIDTQARLIRIQLPAADWVE
jgi:hypothetical protein